jgi:NADH-quinone oxidoreductase subunit E
MATEHSVELALSSNLLTAYPDDVRLRLEADARAIIARYPVPRSALLPMLHLVQSEEGYVSQLGIEFCASMLELTTAEVAGVATFYTQYKRHPNGTYTVGVCINTLCAIMGGDAIWDAVSDHLDIGHDETTADGQVTLERIECNAACDYAPVVMVNWEFYDNQTPASTRALVDDLRAGVPVRPSRGPDRQCTFKQMSRTLAGFPTGSPTRVSGPVSTPRSGCTSPTRTAGVPRASRRPAPLPRSSRWPPSTSPRRTPRAPTTRRPGPASTAPPRPPQRRRTSRRRLRTLRRRCCQADAPPSGQEEHRAPDGCSHPQGRPSGCLRRHHPFDHHLSTTTTDTSPEKEV